MGRSHTKSLSRLINNRKGFAGIIATIFLVLVIIFLFFNVYTFYNNRNTAYQGTVSQVTQAEADQKTELATLSIAGVTITPGNNMVTASCTIDDSGSLTVQLVRLWVKDISTSAVGNTSFSQQAIVVQPGTKTFYGPYSVSIPNVSSNDQFTLWFITARGNVISAFPGTNQLTMDANITLSPNSGTVGSTVTVNGTGFAPYSRLQASFGGSQVFPLVGEAITNASGSFNNVNFTVPNSAEGGAQTVIFNDQQFDAGSTSYTVQTGFELINVTIVSNFNGHYTNRGANTVVINGGDSTPNSFLANGQFYPIEFVMGANFTLSFLNSENIRYIMNATDGSFSATPSFTASSVDQLTEMAIEQVQNTYNATFIGGSPGIGDYVNVMGTYAGVSGSVIATLDSANGWSTSAWSDYPNYQSQHYFFYWGYYNNALNNLATFPANVTTAVTTSSERWSLVGNENATISRNDLNEYETGGATFAETYYHQYSITFGYGDQDSSIITSGNQIGSYYQFGATTGNAIDSTSSYGATNPVSNWVDAGTGTVSYQTYQNDGTQRWALLSSPVSFNVGSSTTISDSNFFHQYSITFGYSDHDSSIITSGNQIGSYYQFGSSTAGTINSGSSYGKTSPASDWVDAGTGKVSYQTYTSSSGTQRWALSSSPVSMTVASSTTLSESGYYHQYLQTLSYSVVGGGSPTAPTATGTEFGSAYAPSLTTTATGYWFDASGSIAFSTSTSGSTERWSPSPASISATSANAQVVSMYNQYKQTLSYSVVGGGSPTAPTATGTSLGSAYAPSLTTTATGYWFDASGSITISTPTGTNEQWVPTPSSISATSANTQVVSMYNQYKQTLSYSVVDGGTPIAPTATGTSLGSAYAPSLTTTATGYWFDASGSITFSTSTGTNEQWAPSPASISATSAHTQVVSMYNQYLQTLSYTVVDGGSPTAPTATGTSLGSAYAPSLTTTATGYWFDASGSITFSTPISGSTERWAPSSSSISATAANTQVVSMYNQYKQTLSYKVVDGGSPTAPTAMGTELGVAYAPSLTTTATGYWFDASGSITFSTSTGTNEQWAPSPASISATSANTQVVSMYNQYLQTLSYTVVDGGTPTAPTATGTSLGSAYAPSLTTTATGYWFDASGSITFSTPISGSTERWAPSSSSISATAANTQVVSMYNQYQVTASYSTSDGSTPSASVTLSGTQFGSNSYTLTLTTSAQTTWLDAGTGWSVNNPITSGTQRWDATSGTSGTVSSAVTIAPSYYHQYEQTLSYTVVDGGSPTAPTATGTEFGSAYTPTLTPTPTGYWFDASGSITFSTSTSGSTEHWSPSPASISATAAHTQVVSMYNQYLQTLSYTVVDGGTPTAPTATGTSLGSAYAPSLTTTATGYWFDASGSITFSTPTGTNEQWVPSPASISATSANTQVVSMYNQYKQTLSYKVVDGGTPTAPTATGTSLGVAYAPSLTTTATGYWFDASGSIAFSTPTGTNEQWAPTPSSISATSANTQVVSMYNQYLQTLSYTVVDGGSPTAPTATGTSLGSAYAPTLTTTATGYWFDASGSITISTPTGTNEQWVPTPSSISATSANTQVVSMYNQYKQTLSYKVVDGGTPTAPTATGTSLGSAYAPSLTTTATGYWFDASGSISLSTPTGTNEQWAPTPSSISATSANTQVVSMYNQYKQTLSYSVVDGGSPTAPTATGTSLGSAYAPSLTTTATGYWFDASGSITFSTSTGTNEQWVPSPASISATSSHTQVVSMYNQYLQTLSYSVVDGGSPSAPTATGTSLGSAYAPTLTTTATGYWFDASGSITISTPTGTNEQWVPSPASISATSTNAQVVSMYNQYKQTLSYKVVDGGTPTAPTATGTSLGSAYAPSLTTTATGYWFDASGSITFSTSTGTNEQWVPSPASISATSSHTQVVSMYNQYLQTLSYSVVDGGSPSAPTATGTSLGSAYAPSLTTTATGYWFDASGSIAFSTSAGGSGEQWAPSPASISATSAQTQVVSIYNQYQVTFSQSGLDSSVGSGTVLTVNGTNVAYPGLPYTVWVNSGDRLVYVYNATVASTTVGKQFVVGTVSPVSPLVGISSAQTVTGSYTTQYKLTFAQSGLDNSATGTVVTVNSAAQTYSNLPCTTVWINSGSTVTYTYNNPVTSSTTGKQFRLNSVTGSASPITVSSPATITGNYVVQWQVTFDASSNIKGDSTATIITVAGTALTGAQLPYANYYDSGSSLSYSYASAVASTSSPSTMGYIWSSTGGLGQSSRSTSFTVSASGTVTGTFTATTFGLDTNCEGFGSGTTSSAITTTSMTAQANELIIIVITQGSSSSGSSLRTFTITDSFSSGDLSYIQRTTLGSGSYREGISEYYAVTDSSHTGSFTITVTPSSSSNFDVQVFGILGANTASPFDSHTGLPYTGYSTGSSIPTVTGVSTSNPNDMILGLEGHLSSTAETAGSYFTGTILHNVNSEGNNVGYTTVTSTLSSSNIAFGTSVTNWVIIVDAVQRAW